MQTNQSEPGHQQMGDRCLRMPERPIGARYIVLDLRDEDTRRDRAPIRPILFVLSIAGGAAAGLAITAFAAFIKVAS